MVIFYSLNLLGQEIITLPYDNTGLDYQGPELETSIYTINPTTTGGKDIIVLRILIKVILKGKL